MITDALAQTRVSRSDIRQGLAAVGVNDTGVLYLVGSLAGIIGTTDPAGSVSREAMSLLGIAGTLVVPTFSFSFCDLGVFDREATGTFCGDLSLKVMSIPGVQRTWRPPVHTVAAIGARSTEIAAVAAETSFGETSVFQWLVDADATVCMFGCSLTDGVAHIHWFEERHRVEYRQWRWYSGTVLLGGESRQYSFRRYDRVAGANPDADHVMRAFAKSGAVREQRTGLSIISAFKLSNLVEYLDPIFRLDPSVLLRG